MIAEFVVIGLITAGIMAVVTVCIVASVHALEDEARVRRELSRLERLERLR